MIDNPLPDQVMDQMDQQYMAEQFDEHAKDRAYEIAEQFKLNPDFYDEFAEYYMDLCRESDEGYSIIATKDYIDDWWKRDSYIYDTFKSPYMKKTND